MVRSVAAAHRVPWALVSGGEFLGLCLTRASFSSFERRVKILHGTFLSGFFQHVFI